MREEEIDRVDIDGERFIVTHFTADAKDGSFRARGMLAPHPQAPKGVFLPGEIPFFVEGSKNDFGHTEIQFRFDLE
jgi:hypothetical protein